MASKMYGVIAAAALSLGATAAAHAVPVYFDVSFTADLGVSGTGSFSVDSADLAAIPATGRYVGQTIENVSFTFGTTVFDQVFASTWTASDGQVTGLNGLCCSTFRSSADPTAVLLMNTDNGAPANWTYNVNNIRLGRGPTYEITRAAASPVPLPAGLPLMLAGLGAFAIAKRRRKAA